MKVVCDQPVMFEDSCTTQNSELAACLLTLGFSLSPDSLLALEGDGRYAGKSSWGFRGGCPGGRWTLKGVSSSGRSPWKVGGIPGWIWTGFYNYRVLIEHLRTGSPLRLCRLSGGRYAFDRYGLSPCDSAALSPLSEGEMGQYGTVNTQLAAALATLGFAPLAGEQAGTLCVAQGRMMTAWHFPARNADGSLAAEACVARWHDEGWMGQPGNEHPLCVLGDAFHNLNWCRGRWKARRTLVQVQHGVGSVLLDKDAPDEVWERAERFLNRC